MKLIEAHGLSFKYAGSSIYAVKDVELEVGEGEFIVLAGKSGCGKSTLLRCLNGLIPHFYEGEMKGYVLVDGADTRETPPHLISQSVGIVFQNPDNQLFALSVEADIAFPLENLALPREEIRERVEWALKALGIEELRDRPPMELSGGQKQKVAIASVLAMRPKALLLDEPTSSLDPVSAKQLIDVIVKLNKEYKISIIIAEHRLDLLIPHASRLIVMNEGRIVFDDDPRNVLERDLIGYGISVPKVVKIAHLLRSSGRGDFQRLPLSVEEFVKRLKVVSGDKVRGS